MTYEPACGADGVTYANRCIAESQGVKVVKQGECTPGPTAAAAASAPPATAALLNSGQLDSSATVGVDIMRKYAADGFSFIGRVKGPKRQATPITSVRRAGPQAAAAAG